MALEINPWDLLALNNRATAYAIAGNTDRGIANLKRSLTVDPISSDTYYRFGFIYALKREYLEAVINLTKSLAIDPHNAYARSKRALVYFLQRDYVKSWGDVDYLQGSGQGDKINKAFLTNLKAVSGGGGEIRE
jgi:tetratricopeptide (TPR) repeat protein